MRCTLNEFKTQRGRLIADWMLRLEKALEYPNCEGFSDMQRIVEAFEKELAGYDL